MTIMRLLLALGVCLSVPAWALGAEEPMAAPEAAAPAAADAPAQEPAPEPPKAKSPEDQVRAQIAGTTWDVELTTIVGEKTKTQKDSLTFDEKQVKSDRLTKAGYPTSNYTLTVGEDGVPVWETMQTKEGEGVAFWRGELRGSTMRGVLSKHPTEGAPEDYTFSGREGQGRAVGKAPEPAQASAGAAAADEKPSKKKKKKR